MVWGGGFWILRGGSVGPRPGRGGARGLGGGLGGEGNGLGGEVLDFEVVFDGAAAGAGAPDGFEGELGGGVCEEKGEGVSGAVFGGAGEEPGGGMVLDGGEEGDGGVGCGVI